MSYVIMHGRGRNGESVVSIYNVVNTLRRIKLIPPVTISLPLVLVLLLLI